MKLTVVFGASCFFVVVLYILSPRHVQTRPFPVPVPVPIPGPIGPVPIPAPLPYPVPIVYDRFLGKLVVGVGYVASAALAGALAGKIFKDKEKEKEKYDDKKGKGYDHWGGWGFHDQLERFNPVNQRVW